MDGLETVAGRPSADALVAGESIGVSGALPSGTLTHRFPGRRHALKVLYDDVEIASVRAAAQLAGLTPSCCRAGRRCAGTG